MDNDILKIAGMLNEDPDDINEMSLTTGGIGGAVPLGGDGFETSSRKRKRKRKKVKKYRANSQGEPEEGEVLYSGVEENDHIKEATRRQKRMLPDSSKA